MTGTMRGTTGRALPGRDRACTAERVCARRLSTQAVHGNAGLTWPDAAVPRIHCAYYDYESFYTRYKTQVARVPGRSWLGEGCACQAARGWAKAARARPFMAGRRLRILAAWQGKVVRIQPCLAGRSPGRKAAGTLGFHGTSNVPQIAVPSAEPAWSCLLRSWYLRCSAGSGNAAGARTEGGLPCRSSSNEMFSPMRWPGRPERCQHVLRSLCWPGCDCMPPMMS